MLSQAVHIRVDQERHHCPHANSDEDRDDRASVYKRQCWCARAAEKKQCQSRGAQPEDCGRIRLPHQWNQWGQPDELEIALWDSPAKVDHCDSEVCLDVILACINCQTSLRSIAPLPLTRFAVSISIHLCVGAVLRKHPASAQDLICEQWVRPSHSNRLAG